MYLPSLVRHSVEHRELRLSVLRQRITCSTPRAVGRSSSSTNSPGDKASAALAPFSVTAVFAQVTVNVRNRRCSLELEALLPSPPPPPPLPQPVATSTNSSANEPIGACPRTASVFAATDAVPQLLRSSRCSANATTPREAGSSWSSASADDNPRERVFANRRRLMSQNQLWAVNGSTQEWREWCVCF